MRHQAWTCKVFTLVALVSLVLGSVQPALAASTIQRQAAEAPPATDDTTSDSGVSLEAPLPPLMAKAPGNLPSPMEALHSLKGRWLRHPAASPLLEVPRPTLPDAAPSSSPRRQAQFDTEPLARLPSFAWEADPGDVTPPDPLADLHPLPLADYERNESELAPGEGEEEVADLADIRPLASLEADQDRQGNPVSQFERDLNLTASAETNQIVADPGHFTESAPLAQLPIDWGVDNIVGLCAGTEIRHGPGLAIHTFVPEDDWLVLVIDGPRTVAGEIWWDTSRKAVDELPTSGTGWVSQSQAEASCLGGGPPPGGELGPPPLSELLRAILRFLGVPWDEIERFLANDPVYPPTGNLIQRFTDLNVPGVAGFDFILQRTYNSLDEREGVFGFGWSSLLDMNLRLANDGSIDVRYADGHGVYFMADGDGYVPGQDGVLDALTYDDGSGFELTTPDQISYLFDARGHLTTIRDRHDNTITLERDNGHVTRIVDSAGRQFDLTYDGDHVASISDPSGRTIHYEHDNGDLVSVTDGNGGVDHFEYEDHRMTRVTDPESILYLQNIYDGEGRVIEQIDASGSHSYFNYGTAGQTRFTDNLGRQTRYSYDDLSRVTQVRDALSQTEHYAYDDDYNLTAYTDKRGNTWTYTYDDRGNLLTEDGPLSWHVEYTYNGTNDLTSETDALENTTTYVWQNGNLVRIERPDGTAFTYTYDGHGQMLTATDPNGHTGRFTYDQYGNLTEVRSPLGCVTRYGYDAVGRMTSMTDGNSHTVRFEYDGNDNITRITDPRGHPTDFQYDGNDSLVKMIDRRRGEWVYDYDENLKLRAETDPMEHTTTHTYDEMYNRTSTTDPRDNTTTFRYDELYRLTEVEDAMGEVTHYEYDANGNLIKIIDALDQETRLEYDALNRLVQVTDALDGETRYEYDAAGRLVRLVNPREAATRYVYDEVDQLVRVIDALDGETEYDYDEAGNLMSVTDANDHTTRFTYDADDRLIEMEDPEGHTTTYGYDCVGNLTRLVDGRANPTTFGYDENDNLVRVTDALDGETSYAYDEEDNRTSVTDPNDHTTRFEYDLDGLLVQLTEAGGQVTRFEYDRAHNLVQLTNAKGNVTTFAYDDLNRLIAETDPLVHTTTYEYDALGRLVAVTDANDVVTRYEYDALDRLTAVVQNDRPGLPADHETNVRTGYTYDPVGNLRTIADANGNVTHFEYDLLDRLIREDNPIGNTWRYEYDPVGNLVRRTDANGDVTDYTYDADDLLVGTHYPDGSGVTFAYDEAHNQVTMTDSLGTTRNTYDALNRLTSSTNHQGQRVGYAYDKASNRTELTYPDGRTVRYAVDANNRVNRVTDPDGNTFTVEYDPTHNITAIHYPNQTRALMTYDAADRLSSVLNEQNDGEAISSFAYVLDAVGNRLSSDEYYRWRQPNEMSHDYVYDPLYRLVRSEDNEGRLTEYVYNALGNRLQMSSNYDPLRTPTDVDPYTVDYAYNAANQLLTTDHSVFGVTEYTYDGNGNRVRREGPDVWTGSAQDVLRTEYTYDYENRLIWIGNSRDPGNGQWQTRDETSMEYDGYGRLFRRAHRMHQSSFEPTSRVYLPLVARGETGGQKWVGYVYDGLDPIAEYGEPNPNHYVNYYRGLGRILEMHEFRSQQSPQGTAYYFHHDGLGSVSALTKHNGQSAHTYRYWDYGMVLDKNDSAADSSNFADPHNHYTFTGQEWEERTRLYHFYAREYDPVVGVWLQQDPYRGQLAWPVTLHRYGYVGGNPVNYVDAYGSDRTTPDRVGSMVKAYGGACRNPHYDDTKGLCRADITDWLVERLRFGVGSELPEQQRMFDAVCGGTADFKLHELSDEKDVIICDTQVEHSVPANVYLGYYAIRYKVPNITDIVVKSVGSIAESSENFWKKLKELLTEGKWEFGENPADRAGHNIGAEVSRGSESPTDTTTDAFCQVWNEKFHPYACY